MPIHRIEVSEYECRKCHYRWINRINGIDGTIPQRCAKCKRSTWNKKISSKENGLRRRINHLKALYEKNIEDFSWPQKLTEEFLNLDPSPTVPELQQVLISAKLGLNSQNQYGQRYRVPDPDKPGRFKYDKKEWVRLLKQDAERMQGVMQRVIDSRKLHVVA
jgi:hypothetical protein